jgi:hypothetical protein
MRRLVLPQEHTNALTNHALGEGSLLELRKSRDAEDLAVQAFAGRRRGNSLKISDPIRTSLIVEWGWTRYDLLLTSSPLAVISASKRSI